MNTKGLFFPSVRMGRALIESREVGLSRVEITYTVSSRAGEDVMLSDNFYKHAQQDLDQAERALNSISNLGWHLPQRELLDCF